ncbi:MAG: HIT family protein [Candidatus Saccharibacteria bacterium]|nr:HIT family protein [Candidatus Saccharibacteria bacterium]
MTQLDDCLFCQIAIGKLPCYKIFEDNQHLGFFNIFPNTEGFSVVIPKEHYVSDFAKVPLEVHLNLVKVSRLASQKISGAYKDVDRCALVFEGMMVDHLHSKIIPLHQTVNYQGQHMNQPYSDDFFEAYAGYITTMQPKDMAQPEDLQRVADKINASTP